MIMPRALFSLLVTGCAWSGIEQEDSKRTGPDTGSEADADTDTDTASDADTDTDTDSDADTDADLMTIDAISPTYGTTAGGTTVTITGGPFDASASVRFGGVSATVESVNSTQLRVRAPAQSAEGTVDVSIVTDTGAGGLTAGFTYWLDGTGLAGIIGELSWYDYVGTYWSSVTDEGYSWFLPITPIDIDMWELYAPGLDQCASEYAYTGPELTYFDLGLSSWNLNLPTSGNLPHTWSGTTIQFEANGFANTKFVQNGSYDLPTVTSSSGSPEVSVPDAVYAPSSFSVSSPVITGSSVSTVSRSAFNLSWNGSGGDYMLVMAFVSDSSGSSLQETVTCAVRDDGSFTIPSSAWTQWTTNDQIILAVGRARYGSGTVSFNNADSRIAGMYWVIGAVRAQ